MSGKTMAISLCLLAALCMPIIAADTVTTVPAKPTTADPIAFTLKTGDHCCVTVFHDNAVAVNDTAVSLSYAFDDSLCASVRCLIAGSQTGFTTGPITKPRTYSIYLLESYYCPLGRPCPKILIAPRRIGSLTVVPAAGIAADLSTSQSSMRDISITRAADGIVASVVAPARRTGIALRVYSLRGTLLGELNAPATATGIYRFSIEKKDIPSILPRVLAFESAEGPFASRTWVAP